jgi:hypothetical protein
MLNVGVLLTLVTKDIDMSRVVYNRLLGAWYVVRGPHQTPLSGPFVTKLHALDYLKGRQNG